MQIILVAVLLALLVMPAFAAGTAEPEGQPDDDSRARAAASSYRGTGHWRQFDTLSAYQAAEPFLGGLGASGGSQITSATVRWR